MHVALTSLMIHKTAKTTQAGLLKTLLKSIFLEQPACYTDIKPDSAFAYSQMIASELGVVPTVNVSEMIPIVLTQNEVEVHGGFSPDEIDNPSFLGGKATYSGSALQRYEGKGSDGSMREEVIWVSFCVSPVMTRKTSSLVFS